MSWISYHAVLVWAISGVGASGTSLPFKAVITKQHNFQQGPWSESRRSWPQRLRLAFLEGVDLTASGTSGVFLTLMPLWVKFCGGASFVPVDVKTLRLSCENLSQTVSFKQQIIRLEQGSRLHPLQFLPISCARCRRRPIKSCSRKCLEPASCVH